MLLRQPILSATLTIYILHEQHIAGALDRNLTRHKSTHNTYTAPSSMHDS